MSMFEVADVKDSSGSESLESETRAVRLRRKVDGDSGDWDVLADEDGVAFSRNDLDIIE